MKKIEVLCVNRSKLRMPRTFLRAWVGACEKALLRELGDRKGSALAGELVLVFADTREARQVNREFRGRDYATDVLSFESDESFGELFLCPQILRQQARRHKQSFQAELGYMVLHGILHLLGYDHEASPAQEKKMFQLQDRIFEALMKKYR